MAQTVLIVLTTAGADTGPFNLYSNIDGYLSPFEVGISKIALEAGYTSFLVPDGTSTIRVSSTSVICDNYIDLSIVYTTTTTTTSTSTTSTTTSTTTLPPDPPTATLTFTSYAAGDFTFTLSDPIYSTNTVISTASVIGSAGASCVSLDESDVLSSSATIIAGTTSIVGTGMAPMSCSIGSYKRVNSITINGDPKSNGQTIVIGGTTVTVVISNACVAPYAC